MLTRFIVVVSSLLMTLALSSVAFASGSKPSCEEAPERRDCIKVEDPDARPPKQTVNRKHKPPGAAPVQPLPRPKPKPGAR